MIGTLFVFAVAAGLASAAPARAGVDTLDDLSPTLVTFGDPLVRDGYRVEVPMAAGGAAIRAANHDDAIASGMVLGVPDGQTSAVVWLYFEVPRTRADIGIVVPAAADGAESVVFVYSDADEPQALGLRHPTDAVRTRLSLVPPTGRPLTKLMLLLRAGAHVDNIELR